MAPLVIDHSAFVWVQDAAKAGVIDAHGRSGLFEQALYGELDEHTVLDEVELSEQIRLREQEHSCVAWYAPGWSWACVTTTTSTLAYEFLLTIIRAVTS